MISVFTPSHIPLWLNECYESLRNQTYDDWEWIVALNGDALHWKAPDDHRIITVDVSERAVGVGAAKWEACKWAEGDILLELDHDDILLPEALERVADTFSENPDIGFVYSDTAQMKDDHSPNYDRFDQRHGWTYSEATFGPHEFSYDDSPFLQCHAMEPSPHNVSFIWYAPNHLRAFRKSLYEKVGGYDPSRTVLDDQDLMCRMYRETEFFHIPECLYLQRVHPGNTQVQAETNAHIQRETVALYDKYVQGNAQAWATRNGLCSIDLGGAHNSPPGYMPIDKAITGTDVFEDLADMADNSVGVIRAVDFLEHIPDKIRLMNECYRVLAHGGMLLTLTPSTDGRGAFQDPTHVSFWNENAFWYFTEQEYAKYVPEITCRFQMSRMQTFFPTEWHREHNISYVNANLIALKNGPRQGGLLYWT